MKNLITCLLATIGMTTACGQHNYENVDVQAFKSLTEEQDVILLDVRSAEEFAEDHIEGAINIDQGQDSFIESAKAVLPLDKTIAIYCRSGRRSASAAGRLAAEGYNCVNLKGGIVAWKEAGMDVTTDTYEVDVFKTKSGKVVKCHALMHSCIRIQYEGKEIEIDPVGRLGERTVDYTAIPNADYIFVTHEHRDHFDGAAIRMLTKDGTQLITNQRCADMYGNYSFSSSPDAIGVSTQLLRISLYNSLKKCVKKTYTLTLQSGDTTLNTIPNYSVTDTITLPTPPASAEQEGYEFVGWCEDLDNCDEPLTGSIRKRPNTV